MVATKTLWTTSVACLSIALIFSVAAVAVPAWALQKDDAANTGTCGYDKYESYGLWGKCIYIKGDLCDSSDCEAVRNLMPINYCDVQCTSYSDDTETPAGSGNYKGTCKNAAEQKIDPTRSWCDQIKASASFAIISLLCVLVALILTVMARKAEEPGKKAFLAWLLCAAAAGTALMSMSIYSALVNDGLNADHDIEIDGKKTGEYAAADPTYKVNAGWAMEFLVVCLSAVSFVATFMAARAK